VRAGISQTFRRRAMPRTLARAYARVVRVGGGLDYVEAFALGFAAYAAVGNLPECRRGCRLK
jgi:hypothetical protein